MKDLSEDCCCPLFGSHHNNPLRWTQENEFPWKHGRRKASRQIIREQPRPCGGPLAARPDELASGEEIELKCYRLSSDLLLVNSDRRLRPVGDDEGRVRARPLASMADGRRHLDVSRPASLSLIRLRLDPAGERPRQRVSIQEVDPDDDNEFADCRLAPIVTPAPNKMALDHDHDHDHDHGAGAEARAQEDENERRYMMVADRLSRSSFLLIERHSAPHQHAELDWLGGLLPDGGRPETSEPREGAAMPGGQNLEEQLISSITIEKAPATTEKRPPRRRLPKLNIARRLYKLLGASQQQSTAAEPTSELPAEPELSEPALSSSESSPMVAGGGQLMALTRPDSVYLWPEPLSAPQPSPPLPPSGGAQNYPPLAMISYNHAEGKECAIALHAQLEQLGVSTYLDLYDIRQGEDWQDSLNFAILHCRLFVALVTPSYGETLWTSRECKLADVLAKRIVPINFGCRWPPPSLAIQLATCQYLDWLHSDADAASAGPLPAPPSERGASVRWPGECVASVARQLRRSVDLELRSRSEASNGQTMAKVRAINSASSHSDSGYDESAPILLAEARETEAILNTSIQSSQSAGSLLRGLRSLAARPPRKTSANAAPQSIVNANYGACDCQASGDSSPELPPSGRPKSEADFAPAEAAGPNSALEESQEEPAADEQRPLDKKLAHRRRRRSLGQRAKRVLSRLRGRPSALDASLKV